jgi:hypothetical protein
MIDGRVAALDWGALQGDLNHCGVARASDLLVAQEWPLK